MMLAVVVIVSLCGPSVGAPAALKETLKPPANHNQDF